MDYELAGAGGTMIRIVFQTLLLVVSTLQIFTPMIAAQETDPEPIKPALLVIDVQNHYIAMMDPDDESKAPQMINGAIWLFRQNDLPVIRIYHTDPQWGPPTDSEAFQFPATINIEETDPQIIKNYPSAFVKTDLQRVLEDREVNTLFLCGLSATGCVLATYFGALEREYDVFMIEGALMSPETVQTKMIEDVLDSVGWSSMNMILRGAKN